jgi:hypothetical protein
MKKKIIIILVVFIFLICSIKIISSIEKTLVITEICTSEKSTIYIDDHLYYDYIKVYNPNKRAIDIGGYGISNDEDELYKYTMMNGVSIGANDYFIIYFSSEYTGKNWMVANFDILEEE